MNLYVFGAFHSSKTVTKLILDVLKMWKDQTKLCMSWRLSELHIFKQLLSINLNMPFDYFEIGRAHV